MACFRSDLPAEPQINSLQDLDAVLAEISLARHYLGELTAACSRAVDDCKAGFQSQMTLAVGRKDVELWEREKQLLTAAETWCREHLAEHLTGGERSIKLAHGVAGFVKPPEAVRLEDGLDDKKVIERIEKKYGLLTAIAKLLGKAAAMFTLGTLVRVKTELNRPAIKSTWSQQPGSRATFRKLGITVKAGDDQVVLEPHLYQVANPAS